MEKSNLIILCATAGIISMVIVMGPVYLEYIDKSFDLKEQQLDLEYQQIHHRLQNLEENYDSLKEKQLKDITSAEYDELVKYNKELEDFIDDAITSLELEHNHELENIKDDLIAMKIYFGWFDSLKKECGTPDGTLLYKCFESYVQSAELPDGFEFEPEN